MSDQRSDAQQAASRMNGRKTGKTQAAKKREREGFIEPGSATASAKLQRWLDEHDAFRDEVARQREDF